MGNTVDLLVGSTGQFHVTTLLNNKIVERVIEWKTSDKNIITITPEGYYAVVGEVGESATITTSLYNNSDVFDTITINIVDSANLELFVQLSPELNTIGEYQSVMVEVMGLYNGETYVPDQLTVTLPPHVNPYLTYTQNGNKITFTCLSRCSAPILVIYNIYVANLNKFATKEVMVKLTSLLG